MKTSIEVEYWIVDDNGDLVPPTTLLDVSDQVEPEFVEPMIEIKTTPCESATELREEFVGRIRRVVDAARGEGKRLVPLGTPLHAAPAEIPYREKTGTDLQRQIIGPSFDDARFCAGTHVHLEQSSVVDQLNTLTALDPAFALINSSSHHRGERLAACARPYLYRKSCYEAFPDQGQLWPYVGSVDEWEERLGRSFAAFRDAARERGVGADAFDEQFDPYDAVWTPVRLRESFPTVEWRSPDAALPSQVLSLATEIRAIVSRADARGTVVSPDEPAGDRVRLPDFGTVDETVSTAIEHGLADSSVTNYLRGVGLNPDRYRPLADRLPDRRVSRNEARRLRLRAADWLEADLERAVARP
ncbi:glutamate-cysteine ligase family protein [Natrononativus amylolyticus]|uniref:glutamate-cysteine ligase family protein n=1 Tax=Natrononativus amylolyticus TaxID=2963434 RepID=UPI0020CDC963|nr:glutamate-cysteine ligase family protein [Natrononativus amylolyticus]